MQSLKKTAFQSFLNLDMGKNDWNKYKGSGKAWSFNPSWIWTWGKIVYFRHIQGCLMPVSILLEFGHGEKFRGEKLVSIFEIRYNTTRIWTWGKISNSLNYEIVAEKCFNPSWIWTWGKIVELLPGPLFILRFNPSWIWTWGKIVWIVSCECGGQHGFNPSWIWTWGKILLEKLQISREE